MSHICRTSLGTILLMVILYSCSPNQPRISEKQEQSFRKLITSGEMNELLEIQVQADQQAELEFGSDIGVVITTLTTEEIVLPVDYGIRMFIPQDNNWIEVQNGDEYYGDEFVLRPTAPNGFAGYVKTWIRPVLPRGFSGNREPQILRIVVIGELMSNGIKTGRSTVAYTDVFVSP